MSPDDWLQPDTTPLTPRARADCSDLLEAGQRWRCRRCVEAACRAVAEITDRAVLPSDVAARRERVTDEQSV